MTRLFLCQRKHRWVTKDDEVRTIEKLLGIPERTIGAPPWLSGDTRHCAKCGREINSLDLVSSALTQDPSEIAIGRGHAQGHAQIRQRRFE